jgi:hypothetical protein
MPIAEPIESQTQETRSQEKATDDTDRTDVESISASVQSGSSVAFLKLNLDVPCRPTC